MMHRTLVLAAVACTLAARALAQQADTTARHDSTAHAPSAAPTLGAIADLLIDASPDSSTLASERRFELREIQLALGAGIDRHF